MKPEYPEHTGHSGYTEYKEHSGHDEPAGHDGLSAHNELSGHDDGHITDFSDTAQIQKAIEKIADAETSDPVKLSEIPSLLEENLKEHLDPPAAPPATPLPPDAPVSKWFFTFMCMNIPIVGWIYLFYLAFSKKVTNRRSFARAYLFYKLVFLLVGILILGILVYIGMDLLDQLLAYMEML